MDKNESFKGYSLWKLPKFIFDGCLSRFRLFFKFGTKNNTKTVENFFAKNRYNEDNVDIIDLSFGPYNAFVLDLKKSVLSHKKLKILDLGCGGATLLNFLEKEEIQFEKYIGVDLVITAKELSRIGYRIDFIESDIQNVNLENQKFDLVFACNSIVYCADKSAVIKTALDHLNDDGIFCAIEPVKSLFWEAYFNKIRLNFTSRHNLIPLIGDKCKLKYTYSLYLRIFFGLRFWAVSRMFVFQKSVN